MLGTMLGLLLCGCGHPESSRETLHNLEQLANTPGSQIVSVTLSAGSFWVESSDGSGELSPQVISDPQEIEEIRGPFVEFYQDHPRASGLDMAGLTNMILFEIRGKEVPIVISIKPTLVRRLYGDRVDHIVKSYEKRPSLE